MPNRNSIQLNVSLSVLGLFFRISSLALAEEESITLTTYYPSPYGVYNEMRLYPHSPPVVNCDPSNIEQARGTIYYDNIEDQLKVCGGDPLDWQYLSGYWRLSESSLFPRDNSWSVGIGTANPKIKLHVRGDDTMGIESITSREVSASVAIMGSGNAAWPSSFVELRSISNSIPYIDLLADTDPQKYHAPG